MVVLIAGLAELVRGGLVGRQQHDEVVTVDMII
jgi:hypothetical protein